MGQLAEAPEALLAGALGHGHARDLRALARGEDARPVVAGRTLAQRGRRGDLRARRGGRGGAPAEPARAGGAGRAAAPRGGARGRTVTVKVKYGDFELVTPHAARCRRPPTTARPSSAAARAQLGRADPGRPVRLTGISVSGFGSGPGRAARAVRGTGFRRRAAARRAQRRRRRGQPAGSAGMRCGPRRGRRRRGAGEGSRERGGRLLAPGPSPRGRGRDRRALRPMVSLRG